MRKTLHLNLENYSRRLEKEAPKGKTHETVKKQRLKQKKNKERT